MSLKDIKKFLFVGSNVDLLTEEDYLIELNGIITQLVIDGQQTSAILAELKNFVLNGSLSRLRNTSIDPALFILASCVRTLSNAVKYEKINNERVKHFEQSLNDGKASFSSVSFII